MKKCWNEGIISTIMCDLLIGSYVCVLFGVIVFCFKEIIMNPFEEFDLLAVVMVTVILLRIVYIIFIEALIHHSRYKIDESGITFCYVPKKEMTYTWDEVDEVSVCDVSQTEGKRYGYELTLVIRIVIGEEPDGPKNPNCKKDIFAHEVWRKAAYQRKNRDKILMIEYTEEKYLEIKNVSKKEIKDYRLLKRAKEIKLPE